MAVKTKKEKKYHTPIFTIAIIAIFFSTVYITSAQTLNPPHLTTLFSSVVHSLKSALVEMEKLLGTLSSSVPKKPSSLTASALLGGTSQGGIIGTPRARTAINAVVTDSLSPFTTVQIKGDYTARGVGLRGQTSGSIVLTGIPAGATVEKAYLYWSFLDNGLLPSEKNLTLNSTPIIGTEIGSGGDTCWGRTNSRAFRADVTTLVSGNGTYALTNVANETPLLAQGASLVVIYKDGGANHTIVIKDGNGVINTLDSILATAINGFTANGISAKTTFIVGDGQIELNDTLSFTGGRGTFTADNAFDGSDGALWDTDTHDVSSFVASGDTSASISMPAVSDCLNWVAQVFSVTSGITPPETQTVKVAIILAETSDVPHVSVPISAQPCKLLPAKTYPNGHDKSYYDDLLFCVKDYYRENSYGKVNIEYTVFPTWYALGTTTVNYVGKEKDFVRDAIAVSGVDVGVFDAVAVVHSGDGVAEKGDKTHLHSQAFSKFPQLQFGLLPPNKMVTAEKEPLGVWSHETGHTLGEILLPSTVQTVVPDLYNMGLTDEGRFAETRTTEGQWDLMAKGALNGGKLNQQGTDPALMSSYTKEFLQLLSYDIKPKSAYGAYSIGALNQKQLGGTVFRYNLLENTNDDNITPYYILETRKKILAGKSWDTSLPKDGLIAYYVNPLGFPEYGYAKNGNGDDYINNSCRTINIPQQADINVGDVFSDYNNLLSFSALSSVTAVGEYFINTRISPIDKNSFTRKFLAFFLHPTADFNKMSCQLQKTGNLALTNHRYDPRDDAKVDVIFLIPLVILLIIFYVFTRRCQQWLTKRRWIMRLVYVLMTILTGLCLFFSYHLIKVLPDVIHEMDDPSTRPASSYGELVRAIFSDSKSNGLYFEKPISPFNPTQTPTTLPDLDLHAITPDGRHVGVNYTTGEYENQIPGTIVSGDNQGSPEWILIPDGTEARYYVSSRDNQTFLNENPDIASKMNSTSDSYEVYARIFDPASGIFTSEILANQSILPNQQISYTIQTQVGTGTPSVSSPIIDNIPPEAKIIFDPTSLSAPIIGLDALPPVFVSRNAFSATLTDTADNALKITFSEFKQKENKIRIKLKSLQYNNQTPILLPKNFLKYEWDIDKKTGKLTALDQKIIIDRTVRIDAKFDAKKNVTIIRKEIKDVKGDDERDCDEKKAVREIRQGLVVIGIVTDNGKLKAVY